ncbi:MAG: sulfatase-like hydrolase/transferase [Candidatus Sulfotelmatobacter sp.]
MGKLLAGRLSTVVFFVVFYAILANLPFWAASPMLGLMRNGVFCIEYAAVGLLALFVPRIYSGILLFLVIAADLICGVSQTFYLSPADCLRSSSFLLLLSGRRVILVLVVALLALLTALIAARLPVARIRGTDRWIAAGCLVVFMTGAVSADVVSVVRETGRLPNPFRLILPGDSVKSSFFSKVWVSRIPLVRLMRNEAKSIEVRGKVLASKTEPSFVASASDAAIHYAGLTNDKKEDKYDQGPPNLVLVLVESWGSATDSTLRDSLTRPYFQPDLLASYKVLQGTVPFYGPTVPGEARELCDSRIGFHLLDATAQELQDCLPNRLAARGYRTIALHGMVGQMFHRSTWYGSIGFQEEWFRDRFRQDGLPDCVGAFTGTCDAAVAQWIGSRLGQHDSKPDFVYWVTLNSHLPVPTPAPLPTPQPCSLTPMLSQMPAFCSWYQLVANVHQSVAQTAISKLARPTVFVVVGDHAPGFANVTIRNQFSEDVVPYIVLVPNSPKQNANLHAYTLLRQSAVPPGGAN